MKFHEYLLAHESEQGLPEKLNAEFLAAQGVELTDEDLVTAAGGKGREGLSVLQRYVYRTDSQGLPTHWSYYDSNVVYHYNCKRCGRILHEGTMGALYCDPCNTWFWPGTTSEVYDSE